MKKILALILFLILTHASSCFADIFTRNLIVHLNDKSRIISNEFNLPLLNNKKEDVHNPYLRVSDLNISLISYTSDKDDLMHHLSIEEMSSKVKEIDFVEEVPGKSDKHYLRIKFRDGSEISTTDASILRFKGFKTPTKKISVLRFDEYNNTWIPQYLDISKIDKIEYRYREIKKKEKKGKKDKSNEYKKKVLFSSEDFNSSELAEKLKNSLISMMKDKSGLNSTIVLRVNFEFNSSKLNKKAMNFLNIIGDVMNSRELFNTRLSLRGFTDNVGKNKYNLALSKKRANSVKNYLIRSKNINSSRLITSGYGESMPMVPNTTDYYKSLNRRVEILPVLH